MHAFQCDMIERKERHKITLIVLSAIMICTSQYSFASYFCISDWHGTVTQCNVFFVVDFPLYDLTKRE